MSIRDEKFHAQMQAEQDAEVQRLVRQKLKDRSQGDNPKRYRIPLDTEGERVFRAKLRASGENIPDYEEIPDMFFEGINYDYIERLKLKAKVERLEDEKRKNTATLANAKMWDGAILFFVAVFIISYLSDCAGM